MFGKLVATLLVASSMWLLAAQDSGGISGLVRGPQGASVVGATLSARGTDSEVTPTATSDAKGAYRLAGLRPGTYIVIVNAPGFMQASKRVVAGVSDTNADFDLTAAPAPPKFEAAGVRGLIDPGGYSVPAAAASASGLVTGIADIQRRSNGAAKEWPCASEPGLKAAAAFESAAAEFRLGEFYLVHGRFTEACPRLKIASEKQPNSRSYNLLAQAYEGSGMFREAAAAYQASAKLEPNDESLFGAGYELILNGSAELAVASFRDALLERPHSYTLWIGRGAAEFLAARPDAAVQAFLQAIDLKQGEPIAYEYLAEALNGGGANDARANRAFQRFADIAPQNAKAGYYLALSLRRLDPSDNRIEALLKRSITLDPEFADAHFELGAWYSAGGKTADALGEYEAAVRLKPGLAQAHYRLAQAYRLAGDQGRATRELTVFEASKDRSKADHDSQIDLKPFISVLNGSGATPIKQVTCLDGQQ